jgi:hypothetical protein
MASVPEALIPSNQLPTTYYEWKPETVVIAPEPALIDVATEQQKTVEELKQVVADLTALVQQLVKREQI